MQSISEIERERMASLLEREDRTQMFMKVWFLSAVVAFAILGACAGPAEAPEADDPAAVVQLKVDSITRIGGAEARGPAALGVVRGAAILVDPLRIAIAHWDSQEILIFDTTGEYSTSLGRRGEGPGEFTALEAIVGTSGGGIVAWDSAARRLTFFDPKGSFRVGRVSFAAYPGRTPYLIGATDSSATFKAPTARTSLSNRPAGMLVDTVLYLTANSDSGELDQVVAAETAPEHLFNTGAVWGVEPKLFGPSLLAATVGTKIIYGLGADSTLRVLDRDGYGRDWRHGLASPSLGVADIEEERERRLAAVGNLGVRVRAVDVAEVISDVIQDLPAAPIVPFLQDLRSGADSSVWVRCCGLPSDSSQEWRSADVARAGFRSSIRIPVGEEVRAVHSRALLTIGKDNLDATTVSVYWLAM